MKTSGEIKKEIDWNDVDNTLQKINLAGVDECDERKPKTPDQIKTALKFCQLSYCPPECPYREECYEGSPMKDMDALEYIKQLEARVPRWIPVTERLPEDYRDVLVAVGECVDVGFHHHRYGWECYSCKKRNDVTHWMPLPNAPEEVDHGDQS